MSLTALTEEFIAFYVAEVKRGGYKAHVAADPVAAAKALIRDLSEDELREFFRFKRAEKRRIARMLGGPQ